MGTMTDPDDAINDVEDGETESEIDMGETE